VRPVVDALGIPTLVNGDVFLQVGRPLLGPAVLRCLALPC
jgi:hypothetical protein